MIDALALSAWISRAEPHLVDRQGRHFLPRQLSHEAADAMATACSEADPFPSDPDGRLCAAFLVVMGGLESGFQLRPRAESWDARANISQGPYGEWQGGEARTASWLSATRHYLRTVATAARNCPEQVVAPLAGERCGSSRVHERRWLQVTRIISEVPFHAD